MEEQRTNVPTPPPNMRRVPPPPPGMQRPAQTVPQQSPAVEEKAEQVVEQRNESVFTDIPVMEETYVSEEKVTKEKTKKERVGSKAGLLYWGGFILSIGLIAFCIFMLVR